MQYSEIFRNTNWDSLGKIQKSIRNVVANISWMQDALCWVMEVMAWMLAWEILRDIGFLIPFLGFYLKMPEMIFCLEQFCGKIPARNSNTQDSSILQTDALDCRCSWNYFTGLLWYFCDIRRNLKSCWDHTQIKLTPFGHDYGDPTHRVNIYQIFIYSTTHKNCLSIAIWP